MKLLREYEIFSWDFFLLLLISEIFLRSWLIDEQKDDGCCALHLAAMQSNEECVEVLLRAGANPNLERMTFFDYDF